MIIDADTQEGKVPMSSKNRNVAYAALDKLHELGYGWNGEAWAASAESDEVARLERTLADCAMLIKRLCRSSGNDQLRQQAVAFLDRNGLAGSALRDKKEES